MQTETPSSPYQRPVEPRRRGFFGKWARRIIIALILYTGYQLYDISTYGTSASQSQADCAIVLGAAAYHNKPSPVLEARTDHAIQLYRDARVGKLILTGGFGLGAEFAESEAAFLHARRANVPKSDIIIETNSDDTMENIAEAARLMKENNLRKALIVSDPWHLKRACAIAEKYGIDAEPSATPTTAFRSKESRLKFLFKEFLHLHYFYFFGE